MPIYSHSRIATFEQCPLKYKYAYMDRIARRREGIEAFLGSRFHEAMEELYARAPEQAPTEEGLTALFQRLWERRWTENVVIVQKVKTAEDYRQVGLRAIRDYWRRYAPFDRGRVLGLERELQLDLDEGGRYRLRCIIDRLMGLPDGTMEVHDYKTSGFLPTQEEVDGDRQLALYEMAVRRAWPDVPRVELVWHYVAFDQELRSRRSPDELEALRTTLIDRIDRIEAERDFAPHESSLCPWCDYQDLCPLFADRSRVQALPLERYAEDEGIGLVNRYAALDAERRELTARLRSIEAEEERLKRAAVERASRDGVLRLFGDRHILSIRDDLRVRYPKKDELTRGAFEEQMKALGFWDAVSDLSWSGLRSLAEREGWTRAGAMPPALEPYLSVEPIKQVRLAKRKERGDDEEDL